MQTSFKTVFDRLMAGRGLDRTEAHGVFERIMLGDVHDATIGALLTAIANKGESVEELVGAATAMRERSVRIACALPCIDTCGTGGDGVNTFNVSTTAALIAAAAGAIVAKHGNRSTSRVSGSTEVVSQLGIDVDAEPAVVERCLREAGIGYLNARKLHPAMKYAAAARAALPFRTIFNLLGPLTNPAGALRQIVGVPNERLLPLLAEALKHLGTQHAWVVHGDDGLCDLTITGKAHVMEVHNGALTRFTVTPEDVGLSRAPLGSLIVDSPRRSAEKIRAILEGEPGPPREHALLNAGAALVVAGLAADLREGVDQAACVIDDGSALRSLERWRSIAPASHADPAEEPFE